jgi:putative transposase
VPWKKIVHEERPGIFTPRRTGKEDEELKVALYQQIGQLKVELDWVKKRRKRRRPRN